MKLEANAKHVTIVVALICLGVLFRMAIGNNNAQTRITYSQFLQQVRAGQVAGVIIVPAKAGAVHVICRLKGDKSVQTTLPSDYRDALAAMQEKQVNIEIRESYAERLWPLLNAMPFILLLAFWIFMVRRLQNGPKQNMPRPR